MTLHWWDWPESVLERMRTGCVIPASPLALTADREFNPQRQRGLTRYYLDAGVGGVAVGVHTTQFEIRDAGLYEPVLETVADELANWVPISGSDNILQIAGLVGKTIQANSEAQIARGL